MQGLYAQQPTVTGYNEEESTRLWWFEYRLSRKKSGFEKQNEMNPMMNAVPGAVAPNLQLEQPPTPPVCKCSKYWHIINYEFIRKFLEDEGIKYEDLNAVEKETFNQKAFDIKTLTIADLKSHITDMKNAVALQLCELTDIDLEEDAEKDLNTQSKTKDYILFEAFSDES